MYMYTHSTCGCLVTLLSSLRDREMCEARGGSLEGPEPEVAGSVEETRSDSDVAASL